MPTRTNRRKRERRIERASLHRVQSWLVVAVGLLAGWFGGCDSSGPTGPDDSGIAAGHPRHYTVSEAEFSLRYVPPAVFPSGVDDAGDARVEDEFLIGETLVTYTLWYEVRNWAEANGYVFANEGSEGSPGSSGQAPTADRDQPVVRINYYDAIAWTNALSEYLGLQPLYLFWNEPYRDAGNRGEGDATIAVEAIGFRLPTHEEWELAARYQGGDPSHGAIEYPPGSGNYWTPGDYASGATAPYTDEEATGAAAWYEGNSGIETQPVGQKPPDGNALNLFDMSGNAYEWIHQNPEEELAARGGCYHWGTEYLRLGDPNPRGSPTKQRTYQNVGLRLVLTSVEGIDDTVWDDDTDFPVDSLVEVEHGGEWWPARVLDVDRGLYYITYDGYGSSWDEWVGSERIRARDGEDPTPPDETHIMIPPERDHGLLFYMETSSVSAYYFGTWTPSLLDVTHVSIHPGGAAPVVVMFDEQFYPIHWMFEDHTIAVMSGGNPVHDPSDAIHIAACEEGESSLTIDITIEDVVQEVLDSINDALVRELAAPLKEAREVAGNLGVAHDTFGELVESARTGASQREHHAALASMLSIGEVGSRLLGTGKIPGLPLQSTLKDMLDYMNRITDGYYDGSQIDGPTVSMLLCRGQSVIPGRCNRFYLYHTSGNLTKCVNCCIVTLACFTDICHPIEMSVDVALTYREKH